MRSPRISLNDAKLSQLLTGTTLELVPGEGEPQQRFNVLDSSETLLQQPGVLTVTLNAPQSYGIDVGQPLVVHGVKVGQILSRTLTAGGVVFTAAIDAQYRGLLHKDSKFVVNSRLDVKLGIDGMEVLGASAQEWVDGGVRIIPGSKGTGRPIPAVRQQRESRGRHRRQRPGHHPDPQRHQPAGRAGRLGGAVSQIPGGRNRQRAAKGQRV